MTNSLIELENISTIDLIKSETRLLPINQVTYDINSFDSGGFGTLHHVLSINGKQKSGLVVKIISDESGANHALNSITLLHKKLTRKLKDEKTKIAQIYPQLIGLPFCCFNAKDEIHQKNFVGLLMYDLREMGYEDFGSDKFNRGDFYKLNIETKFYYSYQLSSVIALLHELEFIHSDLSENAIWLNKENENLVLIDYDSGYHYDSQVKPSTIGKVGHWIGSKFRKILSKELEKEELNHEDRIAEENWVLANAIFELLFNVSPYFFLLDATDNTKQSYLKKNVWPSIEKSDNLLNKVNYEAHKSIINFIDSLKNNGLEKLTNQFDITFNKGFKSYKYRPKSSVWKDILFEICKSLDLSPVVVVFEADKLSINSKKDLVNFHWIVKRTNYSMFNGKFEFNSNISLSFDDDATANLVLYNDFGIAENSINIFANKIEPQIIKFYSNKILRDSIEPIILQWETLNSSKIQILNINTDLTENGNVEVSPDIKTNYTLVAIGNFGQKVKADIEIDVIQPEITKFNYEINIEKGIDNVDLFWESNNALSAEITPNIGNVETNGTTSIGIQEKTTFQLTVRGLFGEVSIKMEAKPFPIPIIQSMFIPTPIFNLDTHYLSNSMPSPNSFVRLEPFIINTSINYNETQPKFIALDEEFNRTDIENHQTSKFDDLFKLVYNKLNFAKSKNE